MIRVVTSAERHTVKEGPVHSEYSFSFAEYEDPANAHFGCLLVLNEHTLAPGHEIEKHAHHDLEIVTYIISGRLQHRLEPAGTEDWLEEGSFQVVTAGTGITHSEHNTDTAESVRYLQLWFLPRQQGLAPQISSRQWPKETRIGSLVPVIDGISGGEEALNIQQDVTICAPVLADQEPLSLTAGDRRLHLFLIDGHVELTCGEQQFTLGPGDAVRVWKEEEIKISKTGGEPAELLLIEMP